jgi:sulfite exporter TauE/SafE
MWITALLLGFAGSFHCIGMCSPLAMVATRGNDFFTNKILYNSGRILTYSIMGAAVSSTGYIFVSPGAQSLLSILLGVALLMLGISGMTRWQLPVATSVMMKLFLFLKTAFAKLLKRKTKSSVFIMGTLNGLLPCGLTFVALTSCLILPGPQYGFYFMLLFGVATLPAMLGMSSLLNVLVQNFHTSPRKVSTVLLGFSGLLLIVRVLLVHLPQAPTIGAGLTDIVLCR